MIFSVPAKTDSDFDVCTFVARGQMSETDNFCYQAESLCFTPELEAVIDAKVESGRYTSATEVVREALRPLDEADHLQELRMNQLVVAASPSSTPVSRRRST